MRVIILITLITMVYAEDILGPGPVQNINDARQECDIAVTEIISGDAAESFKKLMSAYWYNPLALKNDLAKICKPFEVEGQISQSLGDVSRNGGFVYIGSDNLGGISYRLCYAIRFERGYLPIIFIWYNTGEKWILYGILYGNMADPILDKFRAVNK